MKSVLWSPVRVIFVKTIKICYMSKKSIRIYQNWLLEFMPCLKLYNWCFLSTSPLLSFCAWYRCKYNPVVQICCYSDMKHIFGRQARRSFCSPYRCKNNYPKNIACSCIKGILFSDSRIKLFQNALNFRFLSIWTSL